MDEKDIETLIENKSVFYQALIRIPGLTHRVSFRSSNQSPRKADDDGDGDNDYPLPDDVAYQSLSESDSDDEFKKITHFSPETAYEILYNQLSYTKIFLE